MRLLVVAGMALSLGAASADAHPACSLKAGDDVLVDQLDKVLAAAGAAAVQKDEFETTAQFEERKAKASPGSAEFVLDLMTDQEHAVYDADQSAWIFDQYFPSNGNYNFYEDALAAAGLSEAGWSYSEMLRSADVDQGSYVASNAYGHEVLVTKVLATRIGIVEIALGQQPPSYESRYGAKFQMPLRHQVQVPGLPSGVQVPAFDVQMPMDEARLAKGRFRFMVAGELVEPFRISYTRYIPPKIDNPKDATVEATYLIADVQCGILADHDGKVLKILPMVAPF